MDTDQKRVLVLSRKFSPEEEKELATVHKCARQWLKEYGQRYTFLLVPKQTGSNAWYLHAGDKDDAARAETYMYWSERIRSEDNGEKSTTFLLENQELQYVIEQLEEQFDVEIDKS